MVDSDVGAKPIGACSGTVNQKLLRLVIASQRGPTDSKVEVDIVSFHEPGILEVVLIKYGVCAPTLCHAVKTTCEWGKDGVCVLLSTWPSSS